jgi:hypothetical protein
MLATKNAGMRAGTGYHLRIIRGSSCHQPLATWEAGGGQHKSAPWHLFGSAPDLRCECCATRSPTRRDRRGGRFETCQPHLPTWGADFRSRKLLPAGPLLSSMAIAVFSRPRPPQQWGVLCCGPTAVMPSRHDVVSPRHRSRRSAAFSTLWPSPRPHCCSDRPQHLIPPPPLSAYCCFSATDGDLPRMGSQSKRLVAVLQAGRGSNRYQMTGTPALPLPSDLSVCLRLNRR